MLIIDGDYPMAFGALELNRDLTLPVQEIRRAAPDRFAQEGYPDRDTMASLPELRKARFAAALVKVVGRVRRPGGPLWGFRSAESAYANAKGALAYYRILERRGYARIILREGLEVRGQVTFSGQRPKTPKGTRHLSTSTIGGPTG